MVVFLVRRPRDTLTTRLQFFVLSLCLSFLVVELVAHRHRFPILPEGGERIRKDDISSIIGNDVMRRNDGIEMAINEKHKEAQEDRQQQQANTPSPTLHAPPTVKTGNVERPPTKESKIADDADNAMRVTQLLETCTQELPALGDRADTCEKKECIYPDPSKLVVDITKHPLVQTCLRIKNTLPGGVVYLQYLDKSYIEHTKNWICNVLGLKTVLPRTVFIVIDQESYDALTSFSRSQVETLSNPPLNVMLVQYTPLDDTKKGLTYGTRPYYDLMLFRTGINYQLLRYGIDIFIIESDAVWHTDPSTMMFAQAGDIITMNDMDPGKSPGISHGFSLWRTRNPRVLEFMEALLIQQQAIVNIQRFEIGDPGNEQFHIMRLLRFMFTDLRMTFLPYDLFFNGRRYETVTAPDRSPYVRHNNYVVGNDAKKERAISTGYWFLHEDGNSCAKTVVT